MKEVIAIVRPKMVAKTGKALEAVGFPAMTVIECFGRGKQKGYIDVNLPECCVDLQKVIEEGEKEGRRIKYIPKRMISIVVEDADVPLVVGIIMKVNRTGNHGDGKIFVLPVDEAVRIRTGEAGVAAVGN
jgi:nitrogen regulatory protein PII 2